ncbi:VIT1/CCC1 transporter family protein [Gorillibacterium timonense]|uniref:VIT1/CCC1 transporter family protein n=1 Tax=Gorillibacterium timonense TaxID=1689269 RepID=UPI000ABB3918|nr:VIT1/CCC1 transporter family protein [Gorillibacterium timonense]
MEEHRQEMPDSESREEFRVSHSTHEHKEEHFTASDMVRDIVIGMSDGLTVPFALAAGLSGALSHTWTVVVAGLAEIAAGCIAMGLGGFLAAKTEEEHYISEEARERWEIDHLPARERQEVEDVFRSWGLQDEVLERATDAICSDPDRWTEFMMRHELGLEKPEPKRARNSSITIGLSYVVGGLIPLSPYILIDEMRTALTLSIILTLIALFVFGFGKGKFMGTHALKSAISTTLVGGAAAAVAFFIAKLIGG